jgi:hypothetical protein
VDKDICAIAQDGVVWAMTRSDVEYRVEAKEAFAKGMTNPLRTIDTTVGGMHRKELHDALDEWIDNAIKEKNNG